jgi:uncharacterized protein
MTGKRISPKPRGGTPAGAPNGLSASTPGGEAVRDFLLRNPNFLTDNPDLLPLLRPEARHSGENVLDMGQIVARRLSDEVTRMKAEHEELLANGRANQAAQKQVHAAALAMLEARNFEHLIHVITRDLAQVLGIDAVTLCVETADGGPAQAPTGGVFVLPVGEVDRVLGPGATSQLQGVPFGERTIFGPAAELVRSQALVRLLPSPGSPPGLLALGSRDGDKYHAGQGTELLQFLSRLMERLFRAWLDLSN